MKIRMEHFHPNHTKNLNLYLTENAVRDQMVCEGLILDVLIFYAFGFPWVEVWPSYSMFTPTSYGETDKFDQALGITFWTPQFQMSVTTSNTPTKGFCSFPRFLHANSVMVYTIRPRRLLQHNFYCIVHSYLPFNATFCATERIVK